MKIGGTETPVVLDTGSSDLWVVSDACTGNCSASVPLYPQATFQSTGLDVQLLYGDSSTGTHAYGLIGKDSAGLAGLTLQDQYFAAINNTNTSVLESGSAGIFGVGFPINRRVIQYGILPAPPDPTLSTASFGSKSSRNLRARRAPSETFTPVPSYHDTRSGSLFTIMPSDGPQRITSFVPHSLRYRPCLPHQKASTHLVNLLPLTPRF
jgi:hypothetical protein